MVSGRSADAGLLDLRNQVRSTSCTSVKGKIVKSEMKSQALA